jgi:putative ABC transport system ATP-binding protein
MKTPLLQIEQLNYQVEGQTILQDLNFTVAPGDFLTITGPSGSGKSTTLKLIAGLLTPTAGQIRFHQQNIMDLSPLAYRRQVSYCFQQPTLFGETVKDNLEFPFLVRKQKFDADLVKEKLQLVALDPSFLSKKVSSLSGGEKQRVALIRNLLFKPELLLLDEVTTGLDENSKEVVHQLINHVHDQNTTMIQVTHDPEELQAAKQTIKIDKGGVLR